MIRKSLFTGIIALILCGQVAQAASASRGAIVIGPSAGSMERYAARELQRYLYQLSGELLSIVTKDPANGRPVFVVGTEKSNPMIKRMAASGGISLDGLGPQGYALKLTKLSGLGDHLIIAGKDETGVLYGVYGLLDDHYGIGFYMGGDVLPAKKRFDLPDVDETKTPAVAVRGFLPWTNFPQSATVYSWEDWKFIIDQMTKMRMNFIHIHNYNGSGNHNEMFHNFPYKGELSRVWMPTARTGHGWAGPGWDVNKYLFGGRDLFDDYDFGADCTLHNEFLSNEETFRKGASMFSKVIAYAHTRGVKIGLGLDINQVPHVYKVAPDDPEVVDARVEQIVTDYPDLDYLICFQFEGSRHNPETLKIWNNTFMRMYDGIKKRSPATKLAVAGWGIDAESVEPLPEDVICAPISNYSAGFDPGSMYGDREYWGCPWLERDFNSSEYYYPYNMHLSDTIDAWQKRTPNMKGLYCLTWRLTDGVDAKMAYIAKAPWDTADKYNTSCAAYYEYAARSYGKEAADAVIDIINQNEPYCSNFGECQATPAFTGRWTTSGEMYLVNVYKFRFTGDGSPEVPWFDCVNHTKTRGTQKAGCSEGGQCVGFIAEGDWLCYEDFDFGKEAKQLELRLAAPGGGSFVEVRLDDAAYGKLLCTIKVPNTGSWQTWQTIKTPIEPISGKHDLYMVFKSPEMNEIPKAEAQLATINKAIAVTKDPGSRVRLVMLRRRIAAARDHIWLNRYFPGLKWNQLPGRFDSWAQNFIYRVNDISSLGNVQSMQNRFVQLNCINPINEMRKGMDVQPPSYIEARGTKTGAVITWRNEEPKAAGFNIYRDGKKINASCLSVDVKSYTDKASGNFTYTVTAVTADGRESLAGMPGICAAGSADITPPYITVVSPPASCYPGQSAAVKARVLDGRTYGQITAVLRYRAQGQKAWKEILMTRRVKAVFCGEIPASAIPLTGVEYYVAASDGANKSTWPVDGANKPASIIVSDSLERLAPSAPSSLTVVSKDGRPALSWKTSSGDVYWYRIYRSRKASFTADTATFVTYVEKGTTSFIDNGEDFDGSRMTGIYYYRVAAVDKWGYESTPTASVKVIATGEVPPVFNPLSR